MRAFVFPGQGSQQVGMGVELVREFPVAKEIFARADEALGFPLSKLCFEGPAEALMLTANSQPAILTMSIAVLRVLESESSLQPDIVAGHSLGEYSALVCAGAIDFEDAVRTVHKRGEYMQAAVPVGIGAMAAVLALPRDQVEQLCRDAAADEVLVPSNYNAPSQTVIAGHVAAVDRAVALAVERNGLAEKLPVSAPFHCPLMQPAADRLAETLREIAWRQPRIPVVSNVDAAAHTDVDGIADRLVRQVTHPVRWTDCVGRMLEAGVDEFIEVGLGETLSRLLVQIARGPSAYSVGSVAQLRSTIAAFPRHDGDAAADLDDGRQVEPDGKITWPDGMVWDPNEPGAHGF